MACSDTDIEWLRFDSWSKPWPVVFSPKYDVHHWMTAFHPFDTKKWGRVFALLKGQLKDFDEDNVFQPVEIEDEVLLRVHTKRYVRSLNSPCVVAQITEVPPIAILLKSTIKKKLLRPLRFQTAGTMMAAKLAMDRGWAINIGGGFHHCSRDRGMGFCAFADITLALHLLLESGAVSKAMIVDLDAHQGNGHGRDFMKDDRVYTLDVYNREIYPLDRRAKKGINRCVELMSYAGDTTYLEKVRKHLSAALAEFRPDVVLYNAGTDVLANDSLGRLSITPDGVIDRDEIVFSACRQTRNGIGPIPIFMVTSGGYQTSNAAVIASSIVNLEKKGLITPRTAQ